MLLCKNPGPHRCHPLGYARAEPAGAVLGPLWRSHFMPPPEIIQEGTAIKLSGTNTKPLSMNYFCQVVFLTVTCIYQKTTESKRKASSPGDTVGSGSSSSFPGP